MKIEASCECGRYEWAEKQLRRMDPGDGFLMDLGSGDGQMRGMVEPMGFSWLGYDKYPGNSGVGEWDLEKPFPGDQVSLAGQRVGYILMLDVLEHLGNPWLAMRHVSEQLGDGGWLVMTVPNPCWSRSRLWALWHGVPICFQRSDLELNRHVFTPWPHVLKAILEENDFEVVRCETLDGQTRFPVWEWSIRYLVRVCIAAVLIWMERRDPWAQGMSYGVVARKKGRKQA